MPGVGEVFDAGGEHGQVTTTLLLHQLQGNVPVKPNTGVDGTVPVKLNTGIDRTIPVKLHTGIDRTVPVKLNTGIDELPL